MVRGSQSKPCSPKTIHLCSPSPHTRCIIHNRFTRPYICTLYRDGFRCERRHFRNIHRPCLSTVISHAYLTGVSIYCCFLRRLRTPGLRAPTEWRKTASSTMSVWVCAQKSCWLREINVLCCVERKNWWWWWSHAPVCVWGKECVLLCCMVESKHVPILRCRHALKSLKLRCSLGSNCGPNSSYFPHIDALEAKEREIFEFYLTIASKVRLCISLM